MNHHGFVLRTARSVLALGSTLAALFVITPSAYAMTLPPPEGGSPLANARPAVAHAVASSGMASWQVALICIGAALSAAIAAVVIDRARVAHGRRTVTAA